MDHYDLTLRPIFGPKELDLFGRFTYVLDHELATGARRPEWMWVALRGGELVARAARWGRPGEPVPFLLEAVLPEHRGNGYLDEGTRILAAQEVPRIRAATDLGNVPMANAFRRAGYVTFERTITMTWP